MKMQSLIKRLFSPNVFRRTAIILIIGVLVNLAVFYVGAYQYDRKTQEFETNEFYVQSQKLNESFSHPTQYVYEFHKDNKKNVSNKLIHDPLPDGATGNITVETILVLKQGRIIGVNLLYRIENNTYKKKMTNKFLSSYEESLWWADIEIPNNFTFYYKFKIIYTPVKLDVYRFYDRCETVINGKILYKDTRYRTETPPLITYFIIPGHILANWTTPTISFSVYFMSCAIICAILTYLFFRRWGDKRAYLMGLMLAIYPSMLDGAFSAQDEPLVAFFFLLPLFLMLLKHEVVSAISMGIGVGVKMLSGLLFPGLLNSCFSIRDCKKRRLKIVRLMIAFGTPILILFVIFYLLAESDFTYFIRSYIGLAPFSSGGYTIWSHFFGESEWYSVLKLFLTGLIITLILLVFYFSSYQDIHPLRVMMIIMSLFFLFYPKVLNGYYAFLAIIFLPAMTEDHILLVEVFSIPLLLGTKNALSAEMFSILSLLSWIILCDVLRRAIFRPYVFDHNLGEGVKNHHYNRLNIDIIRKWK